MPRAEIVEFESLGELGMPLAFSVSFAVFAGRTGGVGVSAVPAARIAERDDEQEGEGEEVDGVGVDLEPDLGCSPV